MHRFATGAVALAVALAVATTTAAAGSPPRSQSDAAFAASYGAKGVVNVSATTQRVSCYAPEVPYPTALTAADGYPGGGETPCPGATTGEQTARADREERRRDSTRAGIGVRDAERRVDQARRSLEQG